jgi:3-isopropylmalate/(R)-2-methylmalate dehydratase small subunit
MPTEPITTVAGSAMPMRGDSIDTDRIIPARFLRSVSFDGLEDHLFEDDRAHTAAAGAVHPLDDGRFAGAAVLLVNANFGCGSSREHAPQAIYRRGFRAVVGESFSEIFFGNSLALGMPCVSVPRDTIASLMARVEGDPSTIVTVDLRGLTVNVGAQTAAITLPAPAREAFLDGSWDATGLLLDRFEDVERVAATLPYINGWR